MAKDDQSEKPVWTWKTWLFYAVMILLIGLSTTVFSQAHARETCGQVWRDMEFLATEIKALNQDLETLVGRFTAHEADMRNIQQERQQLNCIGGRFVDREREWACHRLNSAYAASRDARTGVQNQMNAYLAQHKALDRQLNDRRKRYRNRCSCWSGGVAHTGMAGRNIGYTLAQDLDACKIACNQAEKCMSVDYNATTGACYLNDLDSRSRSPSPSFTSTPTWPFTYYERC